MKRSPLLCTTAFCLALATTCWGAPPPPPTLPPSTPVGGFGMSTVTVLAIAAYGFWKGRK